MHRTIGTPARIGAFVGLTALSVSVLAGCSSSDSTSGEESVGGMAVCDEATLSDAIRSNLEADGQGAELISFDGLNCLDGWAATFPTIGTSDEDAVTVTQVFQAEGQFWILKDRAEVCGTYNPDDPLAYPEDSQVPEGIWQDACNTN